MKRSSVILIVAATLVFTGCKPSRTKLIDQIKKSETGFYAEATMVYNKAKGDSLIALYTDFVNRFPGDSLSPVYLFRAANFAMNEGDGNRSVSLLDEFIQKFPANPKTPVCFFFKGFVYENLLKKFDLAKESYLVFIEKYPNDGFVKDARVALKYLGKTPDQMVKEFEAMQKLDSVRRADSLANLALRKKKSAPH